MHTQRILFMCKKLLYFSLSILGERNTPWNRIQNRAYSDAAHPNIYPPSTDLTSPNHIFQLICSYLNSCSINVHHIKNFLQFLNKILWILNSGRIYETWRILSQEFTNPWSVTLFLPRYSLIPNFISYHLSQHMDSLSKFRISELAVMLHVWCIRYPLFLKLNSFFSGKTSDFSSSRHGYLKHVQAWIWEKLLEINSNIWKSLKEVKEFLDVIAS